jgi:hypothetical protein
MLEPLVQGKAQIGIGIFFFEAPSGDRKRSVLTKVPVKAANILINDPHTIVVALPDLYPRNKAFPHETCADLVQGVTEMFDKALTAKGHAADLQLKDRFKVFCLKYDLEALILAAEGNLRDRLGVRSLAVTWHVPVEDQNHDRPPKRIVEELFHRHGKRYQDTVDAPVILGACDYQKVAARCNQCFKPFVDFLLALA